MNAPMDGFEWDDAKNAANLAKHGISFEEAATIWEGPVVTGPDETHDLEVREKSFGLIGGIAVVCVVHTERNDKIRIISARKATKKERREFDAYLKKARC
jgi:uncharacterized DUF497 family protein